MQGIEWPPLPDMGVYLMWPEKGLEAIHPDDRAVAERLIPSDRVFIRTDFDGTYYKVEYGDQSLRIMPSLWLQVHDEGFRIGDRVEVPSRMMQSDPMIAKIVEMRYNQDRGVIGYRLLHNEMPLEHEFVADELIQLKPHLHLLEPDFEAPIPKYLPPADPDQTLPVEEGDSGR
jgi:hypothetical protein